METIKVLTVSELIHRGCVLTGASDLHSSPNRLINSPSSSKSNPKPQPPGPTKLKTLAPLDHPAILIGTITLPSQTLNCPNKNCLQFTDNSSTISICCDIHGFNLQLILNRIHVTAWNFLPGKNGTGFLEIIKWNFPDISGSSVINSIPLISSGTVSECNTKSNYLVHGGLESISPVTVVPCSTKSQKDNVSSDPKSIRGFLVRIRACECKLFKGEDFHCRCNCNSFIKPVFVYFCGYAWCWHPVITKFIGHVVALSGLKKKLVFIGKEESQLMFVTTENTVLHVPRVFRKWLPISKTVVRGKGECGVYTGVVKGLYMQGMVVELDKDVWLLLTDQLLIPPHSLRVGAVISVRNVHFVNPKFSWTKILILGACYKTSIVVESFSPLETGCHVASQSQSLLGKFIESLPFSARMWVLLVVLCFRRKFAGILSEKEILGSKHKEGLAQLYSSSHLPSSVFRSRHGVFTELCKHELCGCGSEPYCGDLKLVVPISSFLYHCETTLIRTLLQLESDCHTLQDKNQSGFLSCEGKSSGCSMRRIFPSEDFGVVLLGNLKISPSSGRLQLVDETGGIDVIIPDLPSTWDVNSIYEVFDYTLIMEGTPELVDHLGLLDNESFSCRSIFHCVPLEREINLAIYICFQLRNATCKNICFYPFTDWKDDLKDLESGKFHLIRVTHKFPAVQKFQGDPVISNRASRFVEAIILPWDLFLSGKDGTTHPSEVSIDQLNKHMECHVGKSYQEHVSSKRHKTDHTSTGVLISGLLHDISDDGIEQNACSGSSRECSDEQSHGSHEIQCLATIRSVNNHSLVSSGILYCTNANVKTDVDCRATGVKVLLEFKSENFSKYELLKIGGYYITKHHREDSFCNLKDSDYVSSFKVLITSTTHIWSLCFSANEVLPTNNQLHHLPSDIVSFRNNEVHSGEKIELLPQRSTGDSPGTCSDIYLYVSTDVIDLLSVNSEGLEERLIKPALPPEETSNISQCNWTMLPASMLSSGSPKSNCLYPEGNLISLRGCVVAIHGFDCSSEDLHPQCESLGALQFRFFQEVTNSLCMHVLVDDQIVKIFGSLSKQAYPIGFGPGANATFHRILEFGGSNGLMLTPVSFIVINSVRVVNEPSSEKCSNLLSTSLMSNVASPDTISSGLISELIQCLDCKPMRFHCRVVAVHVLVLEKKNRKYNDLLYKIHSQPDLVDIPLACFVLDDGSSSCCCWADAERAATLLRLHEELPQRAFKSSGWALKWVGIDNIAWSTTMYQVGRILKKHDRITVKNYGSMVDSSYQDLIVSASSNNTLSSSDENLLKFIIFNACIGKYWTVVASAMDSNAVRLLEKEHLIETEMTMHSMQNIWAREVCYTNPLTEARDMIQEMLTR